MFYLDWVSYRSKRTLQLQIFFGVWLFQKVWEIRCQLLRVWDRSWKPLGGGSHLKLFKDRLLLKIRFNALTSKLLYSCCTLCCSMQGGCILARAASTDSAILDKQVCGSLKRVHNVPEGDGDRLKRKRWGRRRKIISLRGWFCAWWEILHHN